VLTAVFWHLPGVRLEPRSLCRASWGDRRGFRSVAEVPWSRVQAIALTGDPWSACPTLWTEDGREIPLRELEGGRWTRRQAERNTARIAAYWRDARGSDWRAAPWAGTGPPWSWQPGERRDTAPRQRLIAAAWVAAVWVLVLAVTIGAQLHFSSLPDGRDWVELAPLLYGALIAVGILGGRVLGPLGMASIVGSQTSWARVQSVELRVGRWFTCPMLRTDDLEVVRVWDQAALLGFGRGRARRATARIEAHWVANRGPQWHPVHVPAGTS
jgi:hypothetical protein